MVRTFFNTTFIFKFLNKSSINLYSIHSIKNKYTKVFNCLTIISERRYIQIVTINYEKLGLTIQLEPSICETENQCLYTEAFIAQDLNTVISSVLLLLTKALKLGQIIGFGARSDAADATIKH